MRKLWTLSYFVFIGAFSLSRLLRADDQESHDAAFSVKGPWFTGPLLAPSGKTVNPGSFNTDVYLNENIYTGKYDDDWKAHSLPNFYETVLQVQTKVGLLKGLDFQVYPQVIFKATEGQQDCNVGDLPLGINIQLLTSQKDSLRPNIKLSLKANAPIGKYQHLDAKKKGTDSMGAGSWLPATTLTLSKVWNTSGIHYLEPRLSLNYQIGTAVLVKGISSYGGASDTKGYVYPGNVFSLDAAMEYNLTQSWVLACDLYYAHTNKRRFSGNPGTSSDGAPLKMTGLASERWSLAPAIEYNFSKNVGLIAGVWFSFAGKNTYQFTNAMISLNIYI